MLPTEIQLLELLVQNLPDALPSPPVEQSAYSIFLNFSLDLDFLERTEDEAGAFNEPMKAIFGFEARTTGDGILTITERGPSVCAMVDVFTYSYYMATQHLIPPVCPYTTTFLSAL